MKNGERLGVVPALFCVGCQTRADKIVILRRALQDIAKGDVPGVTFADDDLISEFARKALEDGA